MWDRQVQREDGGNSKWAIFSIIAAVLSCGQKVSIKLKAGDKGMNPSITWAGVTEAILGGVSLFKKEDLRV